MTSFIWAIILLLLAVAGVVIRKTYYFLPAHELKRRAEKHDQLASRLYQAVAYGGSLRALLWIFIALTSAGGFVLLARDLPVWLSLLAVIALLWAVYSWLPASRVTSLGNRLTFLVTPTITWLLNYLHPLLRKSTELASKRYTAAAHTGLFERGDILKLVEQQQRQTDNRLSDEELEIVKRALTFSDYAVLDVLTPRKAIKTVLAGDAVGPILIDELHKAGQDYVLVRESAKGPFVGTLAFRSLNLQSNGHVRDLMDDTVYYLHENDPLSEALHAFFVTNHPLFVVVNSFEEYVGIVTIENILRQFLGHVPGDDFDQYADLAAVAARHPKQKKSAKSEKPPAKPDEKPEK
ncbi:MAG: CBS domain-containing protein [Candidatus Saccharimonadales bacterium]